MTVVLSETGALVPRLLRTRARNVFKRCSSVRVLFVFDLAEWEEPAFKLLDSSFVDEACAGVTSICAFVPLGSFSSRKMWQTSGLDALATKYLKQDCKSLSFTIGIRW